MVPVWVAVLGIVGTLAAAVLTQILTNRREFQRDQLKWAQERQQREFDIQKAAFSESLLAINAWLAHLVAFVAHVNRPEVFSKPELSLAAELEAQASRSLVTVQLFCSRAAAMMTRHALDNLVYLQEQTMAEAVARESNRAIDPYSEAKSDLSPSKVLQVVRDLTDVYRDELGQLSAEPVVLPGESRKWLRLPWRKSA